MYVENKKICFRNYWGRLRGKPKRPGPFGSLYNRSILIGQALLFFLGI